MPRVSSAALRPWPGPGFVVSRHRLLVLEPYYGGSHRAWLDGLLARLPWDADVLTLPARKWKWRMRGAGITMADEVRTWARDGRSWDVLLASTFVNLAEFKGLAGEAVSDIRSVVYFHENQVVYPTRFEREWDLHFPLANITSALAADRCLFNSRYTLDTFVDGIPELLSRFPDHLPQRVDSRIRSRSAVLPPALDPTPFDRRDPTRGERCRIVWPHRWEHDKNPEEFFAAVATLAQEGLDFEVAVAGQAFDDRPSVFDHASTVLGERLVHAGEPADREAYADLLLDSDVAVSTANNEFFGLAMMEAAYAGCYPLVPDRLVYPELYPRQMRYSCVDTLVAILRSLILERPLPMSARALAERYTWSELYPDYEREFERLAGS